MYKELYIDLSFFSETDKALFEKIYISYRKQMLVEARSIVHQDSDAEDIVHNVFYIVASKHWSKN